MIAVAGSQRLIGNCGQRRKATGLGGHCAERKILECRSQSFLAALDPILDKVEIAARWRLIVIAMDEGSPWPGPVGETLPDHGDGVARAQNQSFVQSQLVVQTLERRYSRIDVGSAEQARQLYDADSDPRSGQRMLDRGCCDPRGRVTADDDDFVDALRHSRTSAVGN